MEAVLQQIESIALERPDDLCVYEGEVEYTFLDAQQISDLIATQLNATGAVPGSCVVWVGASGARRLIAYLAIQKAGLVFFALNTTLPEAHVSKMLEIAKPAVILIENGFEDFAAGLPFPQLIPSFVPTDGAGFDRPRVPQESLSHLSMTSGSTGIPKILPRTRRDMEYFIDLACKLQSLTSSDTTALLGNLWNPTQFTGLFTGARTACFDVPRWGAADLADWMQQERVSTVMMYPAIFRELMSAQKPLKDLRCVILIGESLTRDDAEMHANVCPPEAELVNIYGSMEFPYLLEWRRRASDPLDFDTMPMGREIIANEMRLIDEDGAPVVDGAVGEIEITSHYVPSEYLNNPELTAERVRELPDGRTGFRMGDFAYRDFAGVVHSMGRRDHQTKIRGYNVRPTDVEYVIRRETEIEACVVTTATTSQGVRKLICYFVGSAEIPLLRSTLKQQLPNYMVPSVWVNLDSLPRTHSGKIKHDLLPNPFSDVQEAQNIEGASSVESVLIELFREILGSSSFTLDDDFFDLGGDSLQAMRLVMQCEQLCGRRPPFELLMLNGASIRDLATFFETDSHPIPTILRKGSQGPVLVAAHTQDGNLSFYLPLTESLDQRLRVVGANSRDVNGGNPHRSMQEKAVYSLEVLKGELPMNRPVIFIGFSYGGAIALEMARRFYQQEGIAPYLILLDPFSVWTDKFRWLRRISESAASGDFRKIWDITKMFATSLFPKWNISTTDPALLAWLTYYPEQLSIERALYIRSNDNNTYDNAKAYERLLQGNLKIVDVQESHTGMMMNEHARVLAQIIQSWIEKSVITRG